MGQHDRAIKRRRRGPEPPEVPSPGSLREGRPGFSVAGLPTSGLALCGSVPRLGRRYSAPSGRGKAAAEKIPPSAGNRAGRPSPRNVQRMSVMDVQEVAWDLDPLVEGEG